MPGEKQPKQASNQIESLLGLAVLILAALGWRMLQRSQAAQQVSDLLRAYPLEPSSEE